MYKDLGVGELLITDIKRDGCYIGLNSEIFDITNLKMIFQHIRL